MARSIVRSRAMITRAIDRTSWEEIADGAVLRFLGTPILAAPRLSFPLTDERKSGWLPPSIGLDSSSGLDLTVPYYWNIAPNRDATIAPLSSVIAKDSGFVAISSVRP